MGGGSSKTKPAQTSTVSSQPPPPPPAAPATTPPPPEPKYGTYTPFTDFPTPELLSKAQLDYKEANVEYKLDENGIPLPFPPRTTKSQVFNQKDYEDIDEHARKTPTEKGAGTYKDLAAHLVSPAKNDIGKVRAFFVWIASQGLQRVIAYRNSYGFPPKESPLYLLTNILVQRKSGNYSDLLQKLCSAENIPCKNIWSDFVKDVHYTVGDTKIAYGNFYCIVYVDGNWRIINQHWGSQGVIVNTNRDWELLAGRQNNRTNEDDFTVVYKCDDRYFLPDPVEYIYRTFATDPNDQLLARPITKQEFLEVAYLYPRYFEMGFTSISHPKCSISTDSGKIILQFGLPIDSQCKFDYAFFKSKLLPKYNSIEGIPLERYILAEIKANQLQITINFRNYGKHKIELYGSSGGKDGMVEVCEYLLFSERPVYCEPYPQKRNGMTIWGMALESKFLGLEAHADIGGIVYAKAGRAEIRIKKTKTNTVVLYTEMWSEELTWTELKHYVRYYETKTEIVIWIDLPKHGQYVLRMQGRDKTDNEQTHTIGNFLIKADRGYKDLQKYPIEGADQSRIGSMVENIFVTPETHPNPFINWGEESELVIGMNITQEAVFTAELKLSSNRLVKKQMSNCLFLERTRDKLTVYTRFQQIGMYEINIRANASIVYQYVVKVEKVGKEALPYPSFKLPSLREQFKLLEPRSLYLKCDEKVHFKMMIPNATSVNLSHNNTSQTLTNIQGTDLWEGDIKTGVDEGDLNLVVTSKKNSPELYLCYKVIGRSETWNEINDQISESTKEAEEHDRSVQKNDEEEEKLAKQREDELKEKQRKERENFDRNKTKYTKMEKDMEEEEKNEAKETEEFSPDKVDENQTEEDLTKQTEKEVQKAQERMPTWQRDYERMKPVLALQKLRQAAIAKDPKELRSAIDECKDLNGIDPDEIRRAEELLVRILWKQELNKACDSRDCKQIETVINRIIEAGDEKLLASDIQEARDKMLSIKRREKLRAKSLQLNAATMAEIRSYKEPIPIVHKILQAVLLLFDQGEFITEEWKYCQSQCKSQGRQNILRKIVNVDVTKLNPEIVARVREIINSIAYEEVKERSASAGALCAWATMVVENADVGDDVTPADVERQKELFENQLYMKSSSDSSNVMKDIV